MYLCMKRLVWCMTMLCAFGCECLKRSVPDAGVIDAGPAELSEKEPNNGPETALLISGSSIVKANLGADPGKPDEDWYQLKASLPQTVEVTVTSAPGGDAVIEVMDESRTVLATVNSAGESLPERMPNLDVSGKVFLRVTGAKKGAGGVYTLTATFRPRVPGFELEPNDRRVDATAVPLGQAISGYVAHSRDEDWYRYELPQTSATPIDAPAPQVLPSPLDEAFADASVGPLDAGGAGDAGPAVDGPRLALRVDVSGVEGVKFDVSVMTEAEAVLFQAKSNAGQGLSLRNVGVRAADQVIYVVVKSTPTTTGKDAKRSFNADTYYTLTVAPEEAGSSAEYEPNDDVSKATDLPRDGYREGFISPRGDVDYFKLVTDGPSLAKVAVTGVEKVDLMLSLVRLNDAGKEETLLKANDGAVKEGEMLNSVSCDKSCVFRVEAAARKVDGKMVKDDENGEMSYRISASVVPDDGAEEREPNNSAEQAMPIELGKSVRGTVYPKKDVDYLKLDLSGLQVKTPIKATLTGILKVDVALYLHRLEDGKLELVQTSDRGKGDAAEVVRASLEPGVYVFEVRDTKNREANFQDQWQLTVEEADE